LVSDPRKGVLQALDSWAVTNDVDRGKLSRLFGGVEEHLNLSAAEIQEGRYIVPDLPSTDWPIIERFEWTAGINERWESIRDEFYAQRGSMHHYSEDEALSPLESWRVFHLMLYGRQVKRNVRRCPVTMNALSLIPDGSFAGAACFSVLAPKTHIKAHSGFTNIRWRLHLPLVVPPDCAMRVGTETRSWEEGVCLIFDDSAEHEVWNRSEKYRAVLLFDIWHPDLTALEIQALDHLLGYWVQWRAELAREG
jgi:aspartyl/asparaginyl beta-hydroxylase (cupin superfamily)